MTSMTFFSCQETMVLMCWSWEVVNLLIWCWKWGVWDWCQVSVKLLDRCYSRCIDGRADFRRLFILFSLSSFLTSTSNRFVDLTTLPSLSDVDKISTYNLCTFILKKLCTDVQKYNFSPNQKYVSGCVLLLQILYFHKLQWHEIAEPCTLPLIQHWNNDKIRTRIKEESAAGWYGHGEWVACVYHVTSTGAVNVKKQSKGKEYQSKIGKKIELKRLLPEIMIMKNLSSMSFPLKNW